MLSTLEWLARYGFIDIIFGVGILGLVADFVRRAFPRKCDHLHVDVCAGGPVTIPRAGQVQNSFTINLRGAGTTNIYVARAYFKTRIRRWWSLWLLKTATKLKVHPKSFRIAHKDAFELKFANSSTTPFTAYETLITPGSSASGTSTWLPLEEAVDSDLIQKRSCGILVVEYATSGRQGTHIVAV